MRKNNKIREFGNPGIWDMGIQKSGIRESVNPGIRESRNPRIQESGNQGIQESGNKESEIRESGNPGIQEIQGIQGILRHP